MKPLKINDAGSLAKGRSSGGGYGFLFVLGALVVLLAVLVAGCGS